MNKYFVANIQFKIPLQKVVEEGKTLEDMVESYKELTNDITEETPEGIIVTMTYHLSDE